MHTFGYPLETVKKADTLINDFNSTEPSMICVQYDPMLFISNVRKFALENAPFVNEFVNREKRGIFGSDELEQSMLEFEDNIEEIHQKRES